MSINYKKLKSQIKPFKDEAKHKGYIFLATDEQKKDGIETIAKVGSKSSLIALLVFLIRSDESYQVEFTL